MTSCMNRRQLLMLATSGTVAGFAGCSTLDDALPEENDNSTDNNPDETGGTSEGPAELQNPSFEDGLTGWTVGTDLPMRPGEDDEKVNHEAEVRSQEAADGEQSMYFFLEGTADDGTVWVEQEVDFTGVDEATVDVYSEQESFNIITQVAFFAGMKPDTGLQEADFDRDEDVQDHEGWKTYTYDVSGIEGVATLAVGMNIVWETGYGTFFDNIALR